MQKPTRSGEQRLSQNNRTMIPKAILILYESIKIILPKDTEAENCAQQKHFNESKKDTDSSISIYPKRACSLPEYSNLKISCLRKIHYLHSGKSLNL